MTPQRSTLRISALYHARGMITREEYRRFRRDYLDAVLAGEEPPALPDAWHEVPPGTHTAPRHDDEPPPPPRRTPVSPRTLAVILALTGIAIGGLAALLLHVP